ncbi:DUF4133 domain-containing protein [Bergeyella sp. RCAD1439]|uniref:DUF4133 domain-containing protein n=1 Tax=Bergeyella anatis TaxID=3113737 RepID=UPI002E18CAF4|nr:DUF4133 domain-containing protein [Bergeyella sp. RCAD1439]
MQTKFFLYKSLKKPLIFFGLKEKYIYYAFGGVAGGIVIGTILSSFFGLLGSIIGFSLSAISVWFTLKLQRERGLFNKTKNAFEVHIFKSGFKKNT